MNVILIEVKIVAINTKIKTPYQNDRVFFNILFLNVLYFVVLNFYVF